MTGTDTRLTRPALPSRDGAVPGAIDRSARPESWLCWQGLRFYGLAHPHKVRLIGENSLGAVEVWWTPRAADAAGLLDLPGGVEYHLPRPQFPGDEPATSCDVLSGTCYPDGSSLPFTRRAVPLLLADDVWGLLELMHGWHQRTVADPATTP